MSKLVGVIQKLQAGLNAGAINQRCEPGFLYHATLMDNLGSIMKLGLGARQPKNFKQSEDGVVYLAVTWDLADGYAAEYQGMVECSHCVLKIDCLDLPLEVDPNERTQWLGGPISYQYRGIIAPDRITIDRVRIYNSDFLLDVKQPLHIISKSKCSSHILLQC